MKDYEFLRGLTTVLNKNFAFVPGETLDRLATIADQIERLSSTPDRSESLYCVLTCGHDLWLFEPKIAQIVTCRVCHNPVTVAKISFKEPTKRLCTLSCGHHRFVDNPRIGLHILCPICPGMCQRVVSY